MVYSNPKTLFEQKVQSALKPEESDPSIFEAVFKLQQLLVSEKCQGDPIKEDSWKAQNQALEKLGLKNFIEIFAPFWGKTITFPTEEEFQESLIAAIGYYYVKVENKKWEDVANILSMPDLNTIKYGIRARQLEQFINQQISQTFTRIAKNEQ